MNYPHSPHAESVVLASLAEFGLEALEKCGRLTPEMFSVDSNRVIFRIALELLESGVKPEAGVIAERLMTEGRLHSVGGLAYVVDTCGILNSSRDVGFHAGVVIEKWKLRTGIRICERYGVRFAEEEPSTEILAGMQSEVFDAIEEVATERDARISALTMPVLAETLDYSLSPMGLSYGHKRLDEFTMGMQPGQVTVIGSRSGIGKSALMLQAAYANARRGVAVDLYSLEMDEGQNLRRLWAIESQLPYTRILRKLLNPEEQRELEQAAMRLAGLPIRIYTDAQMNLSQIAAQARLNARRNGMRLAAVDYVQIVRAEGRDERMRCLEVSRTLTALAKGEGIHLMILSQLRRPSGKESPNRPPTIHDLRETTQLENDAHIVILAHRGWDEDANQIGSDGELIIPKQRNGATGVMRCRFEKNSLTFL